MTMLHRGNDYPAAQANAIRAQLSELLGGGNPEGMIFAPGILTALQVFCSTAHFTRLALSTEEYYTQAHFPAHEVSLFDPHHPDRLLQEDPVDALIISVVSWKGEILPFTDTVRKLRRSKRPPLVIADYTHAGAAGFPPAMSLSADIICGDFSKWITPPEIGASVAYLWFTTDALLQTARHAFRPFFLATNNPDEQLHAARWIDPNDLAAIAEWVTSTRPTRTTLLAKHAANRKLTAALVSALDIAQHHPTSMIYVPAKHTVRHARLLSQLRACGMVWDLPAGEVRIMCRADLLPSNTTDIVLDHCIHRSDSP